METLAYSYRPWPDLPDPLLENILVRLPLSGYVRFSAVCRRWRSVQTSHRRRHYPSPPPMLRLPWLISSDRDQETLSCYSPFEDRSFAVSLPSCSSLYLQSIANGWFLSYKPGSFILWNPISSDEIVLSQWAHQRRPLKSSGVAAISPPPHYIVSIITYSTVFLLRWLDSSWIKLELPSDTKSLKKALSIGGKHYRIFSDRSRSLELYSYDLLVVDALSTPPSIRFFEMMGWSEMTEETGCWHGATHLVEFDEEPLLVKEIVTLEKYVDDRKTTVGFELFRADLDRKMWVKVESIGDDRVLLLHWFQSVSLLAADIGARGNCIYFSTGLKLEGDMEEAPWKVFDLGTGRVMDFLLPNASRIEKSHQRLFVPILR